MKLVSLFTFLLTTILTTTQLLASSITPFFDGDQLKVKVSNLQYPNEILMREMKSGLPNVLDMKIKLFDSNGFESNSLVRYSIVYDLWDEHYLITINQGESLSKMIIKMDKNLLTYLSSIEFNRINKEKRLTKNEEYQLSFQMFFNPVKTERIKKIKKWISTSKGFESAESDLKSDPNTIKQFVNSNSLIKNNNQTWGINDNTPIGQGPRFQKLFDKILEQHLSQDSVAAQWKSERLTTKFIIENL